MTQSVAGNQRGVTAVSGELSTQLGDVQIFEDILPPTGPGPRSHRSAMEVRCRWVCNNSGGTLAPCSVVKYGTTAGDIGKNIAGNTSAISDVPAGFVDEFLTAAVPIGNYFWLVEDGPTTMISDGSGVLAAGSQLVPSAATNGTVLAQVPGSTVTTALAAAMAYCGKANAAAVATSNTKFLGVAHCRV